MEGRGHWGSPVCPVQGKMNPVPASIVVFYDGLCGFCDRTVRFILSRDRNDRFQFAPLQSDLAAELLPKHGKDPTELHSLYAMLNRGSDSEIVLEKADAVIAIGRALGGATKVWVTLLSMLPRRLRNWGYERFARSRYRIFGKMDACRLPSPEERSKFIGI